MPICQIKCSFAPGRGWRCSHTFQTKPTPYGLCATTNYGNPAGHSSARDAGLRSMTTTLRTVNVILNCRLGANATWSLMPSQPNLGCHGNSGGGNNPANVIHSPPLAVRLETNGTTSHVSTWPLLKSLLLSQPGCGQIRTPDQCPLDTCDTA